MSTQAVEVFGNWASLAEDGTAITQTTVDANHIVIDIPAGKGGIVRGFEFNVLGTLETVVDDGGEVILTNSSSDWTPFQIAIGTKSGVNTAGVSLLPIMVPATKMLPGNSSVTVSYQPYDDQSQALSIRIFWELAPPEAMFDEFETFSAGLFPLKSEAVTSKSRAAVAQAARNNQISIPGDKGGRLKFVSLLTWPTAETVVNSGGIVELINDAIDITPAFFITGLNSVITDGGVNMRPSFVPFPGNVMANSNYNAFYTPYDDQSQTVSVYLMWERAFKPKR